MLLRLERLTRRQKIVIKFNISKEINMPLHLHAGNFNVLNATSDDTQKLNLALTYLFKSTYTGTLTLYALQKKWSNN